MRLSAPTFILAILVLLLGLVTLNVADRRFAPKSPEEEAAARAEKARKAAAARDSLDRSSLATEGPRYLVELPPDKTVGPPNAKHRIVFGWEWTPEVQADPTKMYFAIEAVRRAAGDANLRVVNVDLVPDAPRGLVVNGRTVIELPPSGLTEVEAVMRGVSYALARPDHFPEQHSH